MADPARQQGAALQAALAARGVDCSLEDAARLAAFLLSLASSGLLVGPGAPAPGSQPITTLQSSVVGSGNRAAEGADGSGPTVYNMGPSIHGSPGDEG